MSVMEDVITNAKSAVDTVGKKAEKVIDRSKLRLAAADIHSELSRKYRMLGRVYYESRITGKNYDKGIKELEDEITELNNQLAALKDMLNQAKQKIKCPECGTYNEKGSAFCNKCGMKLPVANPGEEDPAEEDLLKYAEETLDEDIEL